MNMLTFDKTEIQKQTKPFIAEAVFAVETISAKQQTEKQLKAKQLLDRLFPLENGSHQDVTSYVVDYRHIMAYFKGGQHSGLKHPKQFVAYMGEKCDPDSILFRDSSGSHLEVMFGCHKGTGCIELVDIDDIQLESCTTFGQSPMEAVQTNTERQGITTAIRHWISLVQGDEKGKPKACSEDKEFRAKSGEDYCLNYCYAL